MRWALGALLFFASMSHAKNVLADEGSDGGVPDGGVPGDGVMDEDVMDMEIDLAIDDVVITGTRTLTSASDLTVPVAVIGQDKIRRQGSRNAGESVANVPGVFVDDYESAGRGGPGTSLFIHGLPPDRILVLVDGQRIPWSMRAADMEMVPAQIIDRIEIVKGPSSSLYGADAIGGVANIITRGPSEDPVLETDIWGGSHDTFGANVFHSYRAGPVGWVLNFNREQSDGWIDRYNQKLVIDLSEGGVSGHVLEPWQEGNPYTTNDLFGKVEYEPLSRVTLFAQTRFHFEDNSMADTDDYWYEDEKKRLAVQAGGRYASDIFKLSLQGNLFHRDQSTRSQIVSYVVNPTPPPEMLRGSAVQGNDTVGDDYSVEMVATVMPADWTLITAGLVWRHDRLDYEAFEHSAAIDEEQSYGAWQTSYGAFLQDELFLFNGLWSIVPGIRFDYHTEWGAEINPKLSTLIKPTDSTGIRAGIGRAFRAPVLSQMYRPVFQHTGYYIVGNPDLEPESAVAWNAEIEQGLGEVLKITAGYFQYELFDMLATVVPEELRVGGISVMTYDNLKRARIVGAEGRLEVTLSDYFGTALDYTYTHTRVLGLHSDFDLGETDDPDHLGTVPAHNMGMQIFVDYEPWGLGGFVGASYQSTRDFVGMGGRWYRAEPKWSTSARIYKTLGDHVELSIRAVNWIFHQWDREGDGDNDMPPMSIYGQLRLTL